MEMPKNNFKARLAEGGIQYGLWVSLADSVAAEITAGAGFDWILLDAEHSPNDIRSLLQQLQAVGGYPVSPIIRPVRGDVALIKQYLDIGAQSILVPMVETSEHAAEMVRAVRYPPAGVRGVATARGSRWGRVEDYWAQANDQMCVIAQIESIAGLENLEAIAAVAGIDALFVGPSDLGAALGYLGQADRPAVKAAVTDALSRIRATGKAAGVLGVTPELAAEYAAAGATFVGVGTDTGLLANGTRALADRFVRGQTLD